MNTTKTIHMMAGTAKSRNANQAPTHRTSRVSQSGIALPVEIDTACPRCHGFMAPESCFNLNYDAGQMEILTWRCLQCGELIDPVILQNRKHPPQEVGRRRPRPTHATVQRTTKRKVELKV